MAILSGEHPGDSFAAIRECFARDVERIEIDVHSLDGPDYIVYHERRLEAETTGRGSVGRATPADVRAVRFLAQPDDRPPLLSEVVEMTRGGDTEIQLDLKDWRPIPESRLKVLVDLVDTIRDRVIVSSGQDWNLRRLQRIEPPVPFGFDPGHYLDYALESAEVFLPRNMGAYGYRDDHPLALARTEEPAAYLRERMEILTAQTPGAREYFLDFQLALQMLDDRFNVAEWLHDRGIDANVWTLDYHGEESLRAFERLAAAGIDRVTTNTTVAWSAALETAAARRQC